MSEIDQIVINLNEANLAVLYIAMSFLTFGVALDISINDFKEIFSQPKKVILGLFSQWIILPLFTIALIYFWNPHPSIALGLALIAACPGGNVSNYATHLSKGNAALSVTLTSIVTLIALITTPLIFSIIANLFSGTAELLSQITLDEKEIIRTIVQLILLPLGLGLWLNHKQPAFSKKIRKPVRVVSMIIFIGIIAGALISNIQNIINYLHLVLMLVVIHNVGAYILGYYFGKANNLPEQDCRTFAIETGIQNGGLGLIIIFGFFKGLGGMALVAAWWGVWDLISVLILALWWNRR